VVRTRDSLLALTHGSFRASQCYSREHEAEADDLGMQLAAGACNDPSHVPRTFDRPYPRITFDRPYPRITFDRPYPRIFASIAGLQPGARGGGRRSGDEAGRGRVLRPLALPRHIRSARADGDADGGESLPREGEDGDVELTSQSGFPRGK
jgi:hypothetical protein